MDKDKEKDKTKSKKENHEADIEQPSVTTISAPELAGDVEDTATEENSDNKVAISEDTKDLQDAANALFRVPVFFSHQSFFRLDTTRQQFLVKMFNEIKNELLLPNTLFTTEQYPDPEFENIRLIVASTYGMAAALLQQSSGDIPPYSQVEPAMAFQHGLPLLLVKEQSVNQGGIWTAAPFHVVEWYSENTTTDEFFNSVKWKESLKKWAGEVRSGYYLRTQAPFQYNR